MVGRPHGGPRGTIHDNQTGAALESSLDKTPELPAVTFEADALFIPRSDRRALLRPGGLCGVEFPVALFAGLRIEDERCWTPDTVSIRPTGQNTNGVERVGPSSDGQFGGKDLYICLPAPTARDEEDN